MRPADANDPNPYRCQACSSREFRTEEYYEVTRYYVHELPCTCGEADEGIAARRLERVTEQYVATGTLETERKIAVAEREVVDTEREDEEEQVICTRCYRRKKGPWSSELAETEDPAPEGMELWIYCSGCDREVEFGYSHPGGGGRIWLEEGFDRDFNPWKTWPEPRYEERWKARGWLRPKTPKQRPNPPTRG